MFPVALHVQQRGHLPRFSGVKVSLRNHSLDQNVLKYPEQTPLPTEVRFEIFPSAYIEDVQYEGENRYSLMARFLSLKVKHPKELLSMAKEASQQIWLKKQFKAIIHDAGMPSDQKNLAMAVLAKSGFPEPYIITNSGQPDGIAGLRFSFREVDAVMDAANVQ